MPRVIVRNTSNTNIGFSFGFLHRGQQATIDESVLTAGDRKMIENKRLFLQPVDTPLPPITVVVKEEINADPTPEKEETKPVTEQPKTENRATEPPRTDTPKPPAATESETEPKKVYTREQLEELTKKELKDLSAGLGADGRSRKSMIDKVLEAQGK